MAGGLRKARAEFEKAPGKGIPGMAFGKAAKAAAHFFDFRNGIRKRTRGQRSNATP